MVFRIRCQQHLDADLISENVHESIRKQLNLLVVLLTLVVARRCVAHLPVIKILNEVEASFGFGVVGVKLVGGKEKKGGRKRGADSEAAQFRRDQMRFLLHLLIFL